MAFPILFEKVDFFYNPGTPFEVRVLHEVDLEIQAGKVTAIIGHTGSGKSTLIQHLNVLLQATKGRVIIDGQAIDAHTSTKKMKPLRKKVGLVFQFPESQLFEETVLKDVMFGPLNFNKTPEEAEAIAREKLAQVGIAEELFQRSPFDLSGGQMRRVAIAGVLALEPEVLVLDEPTAGLDPMGQIEMLEMFMQLQNRHNLSLILVSHQMDDVAEYADHVVVMEGGRVIKEGSPAQVFTDPVWLRQKQLGLPQSLDFLALLDTYTDFDLQAMMGQAPLTLDALADKLVDLHEIIQSGRGQLDGL